MLTAYEFGKQAERRVVDYLSRNGFVVIALRYKAGRGEIDIVAHEGEQLVFVEVKARRHPLARPETAMTKQKMAAIASTAHAYLAEIGDRDRGFRLDLVAVHGDELRHHRDLFGF